MLLTNSETFLSEMSKLFYTNQTNGGSIYITMKRIDNSKKPTPRAEKLKKKTQDKSVTEQRKEYKCLIRVHDNKRKISTIVSAKDVNKFQQAYSNLLKGNLYGLKKKDKKKAVKNPKQHNDNFRHNFNRCKLFLRAQFIYY
ncbi:signal recognition particle 14 kda protein-like protein [Dermatophagoides farinae]|uniref:Signal recognition particle 14 kDa protein n=1 Tax=Dermatophagoides farinae TaxID=6954 RepID=A0A9D4SL14_DERFA|nr:signal recognition particle 14 kda protein-like protein [Dermatophagoides farinae]